MGFGFYFFFSKGSVSSKKILRVMTYSSFVNVFGPGQALKKTFEKICDCRLKWIKVPDSTLFVQRLSLREDGFKTDVVLGLDQLSLQEAKALSWKKVKPVSGTFIPPVQEFLSDYFVPYNWSPMSFISRQKTKTLGLKDLLNKKFQYNISIPSPRTSTVGFQFYYWIWLVFKEQTVAFLKSLKSKLYGLPSSWSTSYALFQRGHVDLGFSYLSSLLYHKEQNQRQTQKQKQKQKGFYFVPFREGHPFQVELAGVSGFCRECELAREFIHFLLKPETQNVLKKKNYMFPVLATLSEDSLWQEGNLIQYNQLDIFLKEKEKRLREWEAWVK